MISLTDEQYDEIFDQDWYVLTSAAIVVAVEKLFEKNIIFDQEALEQEILNYSVAKQLREKVFDTLVDTLPKELNWENKTVSEAFLEFKDIIDSCDLCTKFKKYSVKIKLSDSGLMKNEFLIWKELVNSDYPRLSLTTTQYKTNKNKYKLTICLVKD